MPMPKSKVSRSKKGMRRSHDALKTPSASKCSNCGAYHKPHHLCLSCGYYNGKEVVSAQL